MRLALLIALAAVSATACSLFTSLGDFDEETVGDPDASRADGATSAGADGGSSGGPDANGVADTGGPIDPDGGADGGIGSPVNLHPNGAMEFSCQGWYPYNSTLESSTTAHGGSASCMVCATVTAADVATIDEGGAIADPVVGGVYVASGWFRVPDGKTAPPGGVKLVFGTRDTNGGTLEYAQTAKISIDASWKQLSVQLTVTKAAPKLRIWAGGTAELGTCFLVDDIRVERTQ